MREIIFRGKRLDEVIGNIHDNREVLEETPTADVMEVVRCKDCKHFDKNKGYRDTKFSFSFCDKFHHNITTKNDFCSYGVRMDGMDGDME